MQHCNKGKTHQYKTGQDDYKTQGCCNVACCNVAISTLHHFLV